MEPLLPLIDAIYAAAADPSLWPQVARRIQRAIGGHSVNLGIEDIQNPNFSFLYTNGPTASDMEYYQNNCIGRDEFLELLDSIKLGEALLTQDCWDEKKLHQHFPYEDFYEPLGYTYHNAGTILRDETSRGWISVIRSLDDKLFSQQELEMMQALVPHLKRAFMINVQLWQAQSKSTLALDALEHISAGTIFINHLGAVSHNNKNAEPYLKRLTTNSNKFTVNLPDASANRNIQKMIGNILSGIELKDDNSIVFMENGHKRMALCFPWKSDELWSELLRGPAFCVVFILPTNAHEIDDLYLMKLFELSKAEVRVLKQLLDGMSVSQVSKLLFVTEATVRFHIRNLLRKTGSRTQAEMIANTFRSISMSVR